MKQKPLSLMGIVLHVKGALFMNLFCLVSHLRLTCLWTESRITRCHTSGSFDSVQCPVDFFQQQAILPRAHSLGLVTEGALLEASDSFPWKGLPHKRARSPGAGRSLRVGSPDGFAAHRFAF